MLRKRLSLFLVLIIIIFSICNTSCVNNNKEVLYGCDSTNVTYSKTIVSVLTNNCYQCHSNANSSSIGGGINLEGYSNVRNWVQPNNTNGSILYTNVKSGRMPKNLPKISDCDIAKISNWIKNVAPNN